ncbi:MAG: hypothetical protein IKE94_09820 [Aeriscardovia sp.]|nr:hypothetical protein [Aeriscardovia sp.]
MTKKEKKQKAQNLILHQISIIGYGDSFEEYMKEVGEDGQEILSQQMDRIAKMFGYDRAWFC